MEKRLRQCLDDFFKGWEYLEPDRDEGSKLSLDEIDFDFQCAPHERPQPLRNNQRAIYVFFKDDQ